MAAIAKAFSSITPVFSADFDSLKTVALFSAGGLLVSLLMATTYGLDLSAGFF
jgi:flagellar basal body rod protein FlgF